VFPNFDAVESVVDRIERIHDACKGLLPSTTDD